MAVTTEENEGNEGIWRSGPFTYKVGGLSRGL